MDSTGIKAEGEGEWNARKHAGPKRRLWRKIHIGIDEQTLEIRAIEVTSSGIGDAPILPDLLNQIPPDQELSSVTADGAYDTRKCHDAIAARDAHAVIPPRKNAKMWTPDTPGARARNEAVRASKYLKQFSKNLDHLTLPEIIDFNGLSDNLCFKLIRKRYRFKGKPLAPTTVKQRLERLSTILEFAMTADAVPHNVGKTVNAPKLLTVLCQAITHVLAFNAFCNPKANGHDDSRCNAKLNNAADHAWHLPLMAD